MWIKLSDIQGHIIIGAAYLILTIMAGALLHRLEKRMRLPGLDHYSL